MKKIALTVLTLLAVAVSADISGQQSSNNKAASKALKAELDAGKKLYAKYACSSCHGNEGVALGDLRQAYKKYNDEQLKSYIKNPRAYNNMKMPVFNEVIPDTEYKSLLAYVKWLGTEAAKKK